MGNITIIFGFFKRKIQIITKLFCVFSFNYLLFLWDVFSLIDWSKKFIWNNATTTINFKI